MQALKSRSPENKSATQTQPPRASFLRAVLTMMTGSIAAQAIPMLVSPLLTRLYDPAEYGVYATFMLVAYTISALASARYEFAIMLPEDDGDAFNVTAFCGLMAAGVALVVMVVVFVIRLAGIEPSRLDGYLFALAPMVFLMSTYQTLMYWMLRKQQFRRLSATNVLRAVVTAGANIAFGVTAFRGGLILSTVLGQAIATSLLGAELLRDPTATVRSVRVSTMTALMKKHRRFPLFTLPADLMSYLSLQLPIAFLDPKSAGLFTFVQTVINTPLSVAAGAVLDAFKERATRDYRTRGEFRRIWVRLALGLTALAIPPMVAIGVWGPTIFATLFSETWRAGGHVARILAIMYLLKFVASPLSYSYYIVDKQREDFLLHIYIVASTATILGVGIRMLRHVDHTLLVFSINYASFYALFLFRTYQFSGGDLKRS